MKIIAAAAMALLAASVQTASAQMTPRAAPAQAAEPTGEWLVADRTARIQIERCPTGLWGILSWTRQPGTDDKNPDRAKRGRPTLGMPILIGMKEAARPGRWEGEVYNAKNGQTYEAQMALKDANTLRIDGCLIGGMFCGGETWTRVRMPAETTGSTTGATGASKLCAGLSSLKPASRALALF